MLSIARIIAKNIYEHKAQCECYWCDPLHSLLALTQKQTLMRRQNLVWRRPKGCFFLSPVFIVFWGWRYWTVLFLIPTICFNPLAGGIHLLYWIHCTEKWMSLQNIFNGRVSQGIFSRLRTNTFHLNEFKSHLNTFYNSSRHRKYMYIVRAKFNAHRIRPCGIKLHAIFRNA